MVLLSKVISISGTISLKQLSLDDTEEFFNLVRANKDDLRLWIQWIDKCETLEGTKAFIQKNLEFPEKNPDASKQLVQFGIWENGVLVGGFMIEENKTNHSAQFGFWKGSISAEKGLITKICVKLITRMFKSTQFNRIEIHCAPENKRSCNIAIGLGFQFEGVLREVELLYDHYVNHNVYSVLRREWSNRLEQYDKKFT